MNSSHRIASVTAVALALLSTGYAVDKAAQASGSWPDVWSPAGDTVTADTANIGNGYQVQFAVGTGLAGQIRVGNTLGGATGIGTLLVSGGTLAARGNGSTALQIGSSESSTGILNITGGVLKTDGSSGGWLNVGAGANSTGTVNLSSGNLLINLNATLGGAVGATGYMNVTGGTFTLTQDFLIARQLATATGHFLQTGGATAIGRNMRIGDATNDTQNLVGSARIIGGDFQVGGFIRVGHTAGGNGLGSGKLTFGPNVNFSAGAPTYIEVNGNGELSFELGADNTFSTINLSTSTATNALRFMEAGAKISVDGGALLASESYAPVTLMQYTAGRGPADTSIANVGFEYLGFLGVFDPTLVWRDTGLRLYFYGTPLYGTWAGGTGVWSVDSSSWLEQSGNETGTWSSGTASFRGAAGTVTVDNTAGPVVFTGATFATTGYVVDGGTLTTDLAESALTTANGVEALISATIAGTGGVDKLGAGTLVLSGANSYAGATSISAGTLRIDGDQSAATGTVTVKDGGTLAGVGTLGGVVTVQSGGTLTGTAGVHLTLGGLAMDSGSNLNVNLGAPSDGRLFQVNGDLTLNGTLNITDMGGFGPGVYRLIDYTGTLAGTGLMFGTAPVSLADLAVQTSTPHQINLVMESATRNFWGGGDGSWSADPASTGWRNFDGTNPGSWVEQFAVFQVAPAGTVTVDTGSGSVLITGMQFATDGYVIQGDELTTSTANTILRVGDGSEESANYTAKVTSSLTGSGKVDKSGIGTLVLGGDSTYTGGTAISAGTLQLGDGGATGSVIGDIENRARLIFNRSDAHAFGGLIYGAGSVEQRGSGTLTLTAENTYSGGTTIAAGSTLQLGDGGTTGSVMGNVSNAGTLAINRSNTTTLEGAISGTGQLHVTGGGTTILTANNTYSGATTITSGTLQLGNGGTAGSVAGAIANQGMLIFDRSNTAELVDVISGNGSVVQAGNGTTILSGANTYTGAMAINAGTLLINGNQSAAPGAISVASGATLGGSGQTGGIVTVASGGTLTGQTGRTFTMGGLVLNNGAAISVSLGAPSETTLFQVNGDLVLGGVLNIANAGQFGDGLYRLFQYAGTLTDNGVVFGSLPPDVPAADLALQTSVANQVNLVYSDTITPLPIWQGGGGVWTADPTDANWSNPDGSTAGGWRAGLAIFDGPSGIVTVDTGAGPVEITGLQFASSGYVLTGDPLTNNTAGAAFRVGDGTQAGVGYTGTIQSAITGTGGVNKTDLGTLILTGNNTYTGGTTLTGGVLQVTADSNLGAASGGLTLAGGTLRVADGFASVRAVTLQGSGSALDVGAGQMTLSGVISGVGAWTKQGGGLLVLSGNNTFTGATTIAQGGVRLDGSSLAATTISTGANLSGNGTIRGNLTNSGLLSPGASPGTVTVSGNYVQGAGGTYAVEISPVAFDRLIVQGSTTLNGTLQIQVSEGYVPALGNSFRIIDSTGSVSGQFATVTGGVLPVMLAFQPVYATDGVTLLIGQRAFASLAGSRNQQAVGRGLDGASAPSLIAALNDMQTETEVLAALDQLSPAIYGRWFEQVVYSSGATMRSMESRLELATATPAGALWFDLVRSGTTFDAALENPEADASTSGIIVGGDRRLMNDQLRAGVLFSYSVDDLDLAPDGDYTEMESFAVAVYGRYDFGAFYLDGSVGSGSTTYKSQRQISVPGYMRTAGSRTNGSAAFASLKLGHPLKFGQVSIVPYLGMRYVDWSARRFAETGAEDANLIMRDQNGVSWAARVGLSASLPLTLSDGLTITPRIDFAVRQEMRDKDIGQIEAELGGGAFSVAARTSKSNGSLGAFSVDVDWGSRMRAYASVAGEWETSVSEALEVRAGVSLNF